MPYIPKEHEKYDVLPYSRKNGGEVFEYPSMHDIEEMEEDLTIPIPYGYKDYKDYMKELDRFIASYQNKTKIYEALLQWKRDFEELNIKENWSICRYIGETTDQICGITKGKTYYWPTSADNPKYNGVIDDEEFTGYQYSTYPEDWEILEDPTGMAYKTLHDESKRQRNIRIM